MPDQGQAELTADGIGGGRLRPEVETAVYRVVQEALTNVGRHAGAAVVSVAVTRPDEHVTVVIKDDGRGSTRTP